MRSKRRKSLLVWFAVLGPGLIAGTADNDPSGIAGYSMAGAHYGYSMLWMLLPIMLALVICQEMCARMAAVTGKGLADLIRENFGVKTTLLAMSTLLIANVSTCISEFAGIVSASHLLFGPLSHFIIVPLVAFGCWWLVAKGDYRKVERVLIAGASVYLLYIVSAVLAKPEWGKVLSNFLPNAPRDGVTQDYVWQIIQIIGTTITPWGLFYIQSAMRDRGAKKSDLQDVRIDVGVGSFYTVFIAFFVVVACAATLYAKGIHINDAAQAAVGLRPAAGALAMIVFALGLFNAGWYGALTVPLSTAYAITESLGWESGLGRRVKESPLFLSVFGWQILIAAIISIIPKINLLYLIVLPNIVGGMLLPVILLMILRLANNRELMGNYTNSKFFNAIAYLMTAVLLVLSVVLIAMSIKG